MIVRVSEIEAALAVLARVNKIPFEDIQWQEDGKIIDVPSNIADDWKFVGMSNCGFVQWRAWEGKCDHCGSPTIVTYEDGKCEKCFVKP